MQWRGAIRRAVRATKTGIPAQAAAAASIKLLIVAARERRAAKAAPVLEPGAVPQLIMRQITPTLPAATPDSFAKAGQGVPSGWGTIQAEVAFVFVSLKLVELRAFRRPLNEFPVFAGRSWLAASRRLHNCGR